MGQIQSKGMEQVQRPTYVPGPKANTTQQHGKHRSRQGGSTKVVSPKIQLEEKQDEGHYSSKAASSSTHDMLFSKRPAKMLKEITQKSTDASQKFTSRLLERRCLLKVKSNLTKTSKCV